MIKNLTLELSLKPFKKTDDKSIEKTKQLLDDYSDNEIATALSVIQKLSKFIKKI